MPENYICIPSEKGSVNISEDVIAVITATAIAEIDGVAGLSNSVGSEIYEMISKKPTTKGIHVDIDGGEMSISAMVMVRFGGGITEICGKVQQAVASAVESMTGIVPRVNVHVTGVSFEK